MNELILSQNLQLYFCTIFIGSSETYGCWLNIVLSFGLCTVYCIFVICRKLLKLILVLIKSLLTKLIKPCFWPWKIILKCLKNIADCNFTWKFCEGLFLHQTCVTEDQKITSGKATHLGALN